MKITERSDGFKEELARQAERALKVEKYFFGEKLDERIVLLQTLYETFTLALCFSLAGRPSG